MPELADRQLVTGAERSGADQVDIVTPPARRGHSLDDAVRISVLTDEDRAAWDGYVRCHNHGTLFHTLAWRDAVAGAFGHEAYYLVAQSNGSVVGVLPAFLVASRILGRMMVSVPYGVAGGVLADDDEVARQLLERLKELAERARCGFIDLRSERAVHADLAVLDRYVGFERALPARVEDVLGWLPRKARAAARNARDKYGLSVDYDAGHLLTVWRLYAQSMRRLGSLTYPYRFFASLADRLPRNHWVCVVRRDGRAIAGLVTFLYGHRVMPYFYGAMEEARRFDAGNLIYLSVMERAVAAGYRVFDFGRSRVKNTGSMNFKRFCGFEPRALEYQYYCAPGVGVPDTSPTSRRYALARRVWPALPLFITRALGSALSRHVPG